MNKKHKEKMKEKSKLKVYIYGKESQGFLKDSYSHGIRDIVAMKKLIKKEELQDVNEDILIENERRVYLLTKESIQVILSQEINKRQKLDGIVNDIRDLPNIIGNMKIYKTKNGEIEDVIFETATKQRVYITKHYIEDSYEFINQQSQRIITVPLIGQADLYDFITSLIDINLVSNDTEIDILEMMDSDLENVNSRCIPNIVIDKVTRYLELSTLQENLTMDNVLNKFSSVSKSLEYKVDDYKLSDSAKTDQETKEAFMSTSFGRVNLLSYFEKGKINERTYSKLIQGILEELNPIIIPINNQETIEVPEDDIEKVAKNPNPKVTLMKQKPLVEHFIDEKLFNKRPTAILTTSIPIGDGQMMKVLYSRFVPNNVLLIPTEVNINKYMYIK